MEIQNFINLTHEERIKAALTSTYITERQEGTLYTLLYHLGNFFVEVKFNVEESGISKIRPFNSPFLLEPYIENLDIRIIME
ncbi:MAG TPA: hypothetical protein VGD22_02455 [Sphingobacteriaceae bacterium]